MTDTSLHENKKKVRLVLNILKFSSGANSANFTILLFILPRVNDHIEYMTTFTTLEIFCNAKVHVGVGLAKILSGEIFSYTTIRTTNRCISLGLADPEAPWNALC